MGWGGGEGGRIVGGRGRAEPPLLCVHWGISSTRCFFGQRVLRARLASVGERMGGGYEGGEGGGAGCVGTSPPAPPLLNLPLSVASTLSQLPNPRFPIPAPLSPNYLPTPHIDSPTPLSVMRAHARHKGGGEEEGRASLPAREPAARLPPPWKDVTPGSRRYRRYRRYSRDRGCTHKTLFTVLNVTL